MTRQIAILSGKGGAGKTSITAAIIKVLDSVVAVDADVNASNLPLLLPHDVCSTDPYYGMDVAFIDQQRCNGCIICSEACQFDAITRDSLGRVWVESECEGCGSCVFSCPVNAITLVEHVGGKWSLSTIDNGYIVHADLIPGEDNSGKLITRVRNEAAAVAKEQDIPYIVIDGPPGTSCQAISSITGTDLVLAVVEESLSGLSDYRRLAELIEKFSIPHFVLINKAGFSPDIESQIQAAAHEFNGELVGRIPFDRKIPEALQGLQSLAEMDDYRKDIETVLQQLLKALNKKT
jgi:MinD superfamily P-loop ATPase